MAVLLVACSPNAPSPVIRSTPALNSLYVAPHGNDTNGGTALLPFKTISKAASAATPGTTVYVENGTYEGSFATEVSGREDARIAFVAANKGGARLVGNEEQAAVWLNKGDYVDIQGFDISGKNTLGLVDSGSYVRIVENRVYGFDESCISTGNDDYDLHDIDVIGNVTHGCGSSALDHGIYVSHPRGHVSNNISYGNSGYGIHCWHNCNELVIGNNLVFDNKEGGIVVGQGDAPNDGKVAADNFVVANNIAVFNSSYGIKESGATGSGNRFINNNIFGNQEDKMLLKTGQEIDTKTTDPLFVNFQMDGTGDYRLQELSQNVDAGSTNGAPPTDIMGNVRPQKRAPDIGPYEQ